MATPAAILDILVRTEGATAAATQLGHVDKAGKKAGRGLGAMTKAAGALGIGLGAAGVVGAVKSTLSAFAESQRVGAQTNAVLKSTGGAAHVSAKQVSDLATAISKKTGIDDEAIQSTENLLLTFRGIRNEAGKGNDIFTQSTKIVQDMSVALGQDGKSSAIQLGKALQDPIKGITALRRVGVSFTAEQQDQIKTLVKHGDTLGAQKLILAELTKEFGGSAEAAGNTFSGQINKAKVAVGNLQEAIGGKLAPVLGQAAQALANFINNPEFLSGSRPAKFASDWINSLGGIAKAASDLYNAAQPIISALFGFFEATAKRALPGIVAMFQGAATSIKGILEVLTGILTLDFGKAWQGVKDIFGGAIQAIGGMMRAWSAPLRELASRAGQAIADGIRSALGAVSSAARSLMNTVVSTVHNAVDTLLGLGSWVVSRIKDGILGAADTIAGAASWIKNRVVEFVHNEIDGFSNIGNWIVGRITDGIRGAGKAISDAASWLKDQVVNAVKKFFGISSPSKVMMDLGGHIASGLIKGVVGKDVPGFLKAHFGGVADFATNLLSSGWKGLKGFFGSGAKGGGGIGVGGIFGDQLAKWLTQALVLTGHFSPGNLAALRGRAIQESGGNPNAINLWDQNAKAGHPSKGLLQTIDSTFAKYRDPQLPNNIYDPIANAVAAIRYMYAVYGHIVGPSNSGYALGTMGARKGWAWVGERGPELMRFNGGEQVRSTGRSMVAASGPQVIHEHHYHGPVVQDKDFLTYMRNLNQGFGRQNGRPAFGA